LRSTLLAREQCRHPVRRTARVGEKGFEALCQSRFFIRSLGSNQAPLQRGTRARRKLPRGGTCPPVLGPECAAQTLVNDSRSEGAIRQLRRPPDLPGRRHTVPGPCRALVASSEKARTRACLPAGPPQPGEGPAIDEAGGGWRNGAIAPDPTAHPPRSRRAQPMGQSQPSPSGLDGTSPEELDLRAGVHERRR
jgi:hypothetical protein